MPKDFRNILNNRRNTNQWTLIYNAKETLKTQRIAQTNPVELVGSSLNEGPFEDPKLVRHA